MPGPSRAHSRVALVVLVLATVVTAAAPWPMPGAGVAAAAARFDVDSTLDEPDELGDGLCVSTPSARCTLRAAVEETERAGSGLVVLPPGVFTLDRHELAPGGHETARGDLDIRSSLTITGAGADRTVIDGDSRDRVFDIHSGASVYIGRLAIRNARATFSFPTHHRHGAAIHNHGSLTLVDSTISDSVASAGSPWGGGGLTNAGNGQARLQNVTFARNSTTYRGGGIENGGRLDLFNVTLSDNSAPIGWGGAISSGTGFFAMSATALARVNNTIAAGNLPGGDNNCDDRLSAATILSLGHNLDSGHFCGFRATGDLEDAYAGLSLRHGSAGSVFLYELAAASRAVDAGSGPYDASTDAGCPTTDQRGVSRPQDGDGVGGAICDIGAFEREPPLRDLAAEPASMRLLKGVVRSGSATHLERDDGRLLRLRSTTRGVVRWYATFTGIADGARDVRVTYRGSNTAPCRQVLAVRSWPDGRWKRIARRTVGRSERTLAATVPRPHDHVSSSGRMRVRISCVGSPRGYTARADLLRVEYRAP